MTAIAIVIDHREKAPYSFDDLGVEVTIERACLWAGDYALPDADDAVAVERKSLIDLYSTLSMRERRRLFEIELERLESMHTRHVVGGGCVVVESLYLTAEPPAKVGISAGDLARMIERYRRYWPNVAWVACDGRREAEKATLEWLVKHQRWIETGREDG